MSAGFGGWLASSDWRVWWPCLALWDHGGRAGRCCFPGKLPRFVSGARERKPRLLSLLLRRPRGESDEAGSSGLTAVSGDMESRGFLSRGCVDLLCGVLYCATNLHAGKRPPEKGLDGKPELSLLRALMSLAPPPLPADRTMGDTICRVPCYRNAAGPIGQ